MLEPVTAIGVASSIITFVDFSVKLARFVARVYELEDGFLVPDGSREATVRELQRLAARLVPPDPALLRGSERELCLLAAECYVLAGKMAGLLAQTDARGQMPAWAADAAAASHGPSADRLLRRPRLWAAARSKAHRDRDRDRDRAQLAARLGACHRQLQHHALLRSRASGDALLECVRRGTADGVRGPKLLPPPPLKTSTFASTRAARQLLHLHHGRGPQTPDKDTKRHPTPASAWLLGAVPRAKALRKLDGDEKHNTDQTYTHRLRLQRTRHANGGAA